MISKEDIKILEDELNKERQKLADLNFRKNKNIETFEREQPEYIKKKVLYNNYNSADKRVKLNALLLPTSYASIFILAFVTPGNKILNFNYALIASSLSLASYIMLNEKDFIILKNKEVKTYKKFIEYYEANEFNRTNEKFELLVEIPKQEAIVNNLEKTLEDAKKILYKDNCNEQPVKKEERIINFDLISDEKRMSLNRNRNY